MGFWTALQFLTILPAPRHRPVTPEDCGRSLVYFPVVGLILGAILIGLQFLLNWILPSSMVFALVVAVLALLTGAHHLDGLGDTFDGVTAGTTKAERLVKMSNGKTGTFGIVAIIIVLLLKYIAFTSAPRLAAFLVMPVLSRWIMVSSIFFFPYAKPSGMGLAFKQGARWWRFLIATIVALAVAFIVMELWGVVLMAGLWLITFLGALYFKSRLGGLTGDTYGALNELSEVTILLLLNLVWRV